MIWPKAHLLTLFDLAPCVFFLGRGIGYYNTVGNLSVLMDPLGLQLGLTDFVEAFKHLKLFFSF